MGMQKGICMELKEDRSIFLLKSGQFVKGQPAGSAAVGEESYFYPVNMKIEKRSWNPLWVQAIAAIAVLAIFLSVVISSDEAFAYVQVEINPGLELGVTEEGKVISLRPLNEDGTVLIGQLKGWQDRPLNSILSQIFEASISTRTEDITITTIGAAKEGKSLTSIDKMVQLVSSEIANDRISVYLKEASREDWRRSVKEHVPVGDFIEKSIPVKIEQTPATELEKSAVKKKDPAKQKEDTVPAQDKKPEKPVKEKTDKPEHPNNKNTVPGQDKKQQAPAKEAKEKPTPAAKPQSQPEAKPKPELKPKPESKPEPESEPKQESKPKSEPKAKPKPEPKSDNRNNTPGQDKKNTNEPAKEKPGNNSQDNKDKVPGQERKPDKEEGKGNSSPGNSEPGPKGNGPGKSDPPGQQKKNKDGKE